MSQWGKLRVFGTCTFVPYFIGKPFVPTTPDSIIDRMVLVDAYRLNGEITERDVKAAIAFVGKRRAEWDAA